MSDSKADAPFVFEGSVTSVAASNVAAVPADPNTAIVQVNHVRHAPRALAGFAGKEITVRMAPNEKVAVGQQATFFADGLVFADHLAVQSLGHDPLASTEAKGALTGASPVVRRLRRRIDQAHCVVSGQVAEVRDPPAAALQEMTSGPISEHAPLWQEAVIAVSDVHKGPLQKNVVVRFPTSTDVRWRKAPRFKKNQQGIWLLQAGVPPVAAERKAAAPVPAADKPPAAGYYTALDPDDFHSTADAPVVAAMLPAAAPSTPTPPAKAVVRKGGAKKATAKKAPAKKPAAKKAAAKAKPAAKTRGKKRPS